MVGRLEVKIEVEATRDLISDPISDKISVYFGMDTCMYSGCSPYTFYRYDRLNIA